METIDELIAEAEKCLLYTAAPDATNAAINSIAASLLALAKMQRSSLGSDE